MDEIGQGRVLALDHGTKRVGWAVSDLLRMIVHEAGTVSYKTPESLREQLAEIISGFGVTEIVVGYPYNMDGTAGPQAELVDGFIRELAEKTGCPVKKADERLSSSTAERIIRRTGTRKQRRDKGLIDAKAAIIILNEYIGASTAEY